MRLLIVIVNYKVADLTIQCLRSLTPEVARVPGMRVAVCENGTGPESVQTLQRAIDENGWASWVDLSSVFPNRGFTGGNNAVIRPAMASNDPPQYVVLLNADTIIHPGAMQLLVDFMDAHPRAGVAGSWLEGLDGVVQASPFRFYGIATEFDRGLKMGIVSRLLKRWAVIPPKPTSAQKADWVSGASMIIRKEVIDAIGPLDDDYYTYFDDIDYCLSAHKAGWETWFVPESRVIHLEGSSTGIKTKDENAKVKRRANYWYQARRRFWLKHHNAMYALLADLAFISGFALWRLRRFIQRKTDRDPQGMLWDSIRNSVFVTGFKLRAVENPAMAGAKEIENAEGRRQNEKTDAAPLSPSKL
jgi:N-acetylglucosaminyl-diphospho-decaprenol L-rhamnosyltransferase